MSHEPSCPYYRDIRMPGCTCLPVQSILRRSSTLQNPPTVLPDAIQSTRLIRRAYPDAPVPEKRVHFHPSQRPRLQLPSDESYTRDKTRALTTTRLKPTACTPRSILRPGPNIDIDIPTIYIITFATDTYPLTHENVNYLLATQIPQRPPSSFTSNLSATRSTPIPHIYTLPVHVFPPPPAPLCAIYSGISPLIQDIVLSHPPAARAVQSAIRRLLEEGRKGVRECSMSVCCHAGTHRSVAVGERIAQGVKARVGEGGGSVRVVVRHVSRVKGRGDPF